MNASLICAHLIGDFLLQNHSMQRKSKSSWVCTVHVAAYSIPFAWLVWSGQIPAWFACAVLVQHWIQDRFAIHMKWMKAYGQTEPALWPVGPLCMDQAMHLGFMWVLSEVSK